jgi:predicted  nucleic acid-binding Zn-ribbon protein
MSSRPDMRDTVREDERRRRDEAKIIALQQQLDDMRSLVRELTTRQARNEEQFRSYELALAQVRTAGEQHRHEITQTLQARQLEDSRMRQNLTDLEGRIEETGRPIRSLQAHITEIVETLRRGRDDSDDDLRRYEELRAVIEHVAAIAERNSSVSQVIRESVESLRTDQEQTRRELQLAEDSVKIVEQEVRRRFAEFDQDTKNLAARIDEYKSVFSQLDAQIEAVRVSVVHIDPALENLAQIDGQIQEEIVRYVTQSDERDELLAERIDELRRQADTQVRDLRQIGEQRYERVNARIDSLIDVDRELSYRLNVIELRIDEVREISSKLRRELWHLHELRSRMRLDQAQAELESISEARRAAEQEIASERADRPDRTERAGGNGSTA